MNNKSHWNILLSDLVDKNQFIETLLSENNSGELVAFNTLKGILFSDSTIQQFIEKEDQYDICEATAAGKNRKLRTFSLG